MVDSTPVALIADVIGSRRRANRTEVQRSVEAALDRVAEVIAPLQPFRATVGDEFQAVYASRSEALRATLLAGLQPLDEAPLRFGLGEGEVGPIASVTSPHIQDGPGWWHAREAVESAAEQQRRLPFLRTWFVSGVADEDTVVNSYLLVRDQLMDGLSVRARDYARGVAEGRSQKEIAAEYGVSQPAVSKLLRDSGATAVVEGFRVLA